MRTRTRPAVSVRAVVVVGLVVLVAVVWVLSASSDAHRAQQSAAVRARWSARFNGEFARLLAARDTLARLRVAAYGPRSTPEVRAGYRRALDACRQDVGRYDADASSFAGRPWVPGGLPGWISASGYCGRR